MSTALDDIKGAQLQVINNNEYKTVKELTASITPSTNVSAWTYV